MAAGIQAAGIRVSVRIKYLFCASGFGGDYFMKEFWFLIVLAPLGRSLIELGLSLFRCSVYSMPSVAISGNSSKKTGPLLKTATGSPVHDV